MIIEKRNGSRVLFDANRIITAICQAAVDVDKSISNETIQLAEDIAQSIYETLKDNRKKLYGVEDIQDMVIDHLNKSKRPDIGGAYSAYRQIRARERERMTERDRIIRDKLAARNVVNANANMDENSFSGRMSEARDVITKDIALHETMSTMAMRNHEENMIYTHDLNSYVIGSHNCFGRDTRLITDTGIKSFAQMHDGDTIRVIDKDGNWRDAVVRCYGRQPMYYITLTRIGVGKTKVVSATRNHRWILADGSVTENLRVGDVIQPLNEMIRTAPKTYRDAEMFCLGFIIGDGFDHQGFIKARLCGKKSQFVRYFLQANYLITPVSGDVFASKKAFINKQDFLDHKMWRLLSLRDKQMLFEGYYAADGGKTTNVSQIWTSDIRVKEMIEEISALDGYHIYKCQEIIHDTNYKTKAKLFNIVFTTRYSKNTTWKVTDIKAKKHADYEAWCVEEPVTHSFTLEDGIVTGNCLSIPFDECLKNGVQVGETFLRPARSVNTAMQLVAVISQVQSQCQFGGTSSTHTDWTMVPYVRMSFRKHFKDGMKWIEHADTPQDIIDRAPEDMSIEDEHYKQFKNAYEYAVEMTRKETYQAAEGLYHNLNSLKSRGGGQLKQGWLA